MIKNLWFLSPNNAIIQDEKGNLHEYLVKRDAAGNMVFYARRTMSIEK